MPEFNVYLQKDVMALGSTRTVRIPYGANPVTATNDADAITTVASSFADSIDKTDALGTYIAEQVSQTTTMVVTNFTYTPQYGEG